MDRRRFLATAAWAVMSVTVSSALGACLRDDAGVTPSRRNYRVGWLSRGTAAVVTSPEHRAFYERLAELGYRDGTNITFDYHWGSGAPITAEAVGKLVERSPDVIVAENMAAAVPAGTFQFSVPVVFIVEPDPVATHLVASFSRPGGGMTGVTLDNLGFAAGKRLELLIEALPSVRRVAVFFDPNHNPGPLSYTKDAALQLGVVVDEWPASVMRDLDAALESLAKDRPDALVVFSGGIVNEEGLRILRFTRENRIPTMSDFPVWIGDGQESALMCYSANEVALYRSAADYVDQILRGAKPAELPVERPSIYDFTINLRLAEVMGLTLSKASLGRATHVIR